MTPAPDRSSGESGFSGSRIAGRSAFLSRLSLSGSQHRGMVRTVRRNRDRIERRRPRARKGDGFPWHFADGAGTCGFSAGWLLLPPLLWLLVVLIAPTGWVRRQIVARLESRSGRRVTLEGRLRRPAGRDSPDQPGDRLAAGHGGPLAEGRRHPARLRAVPDARRPLPAGAGRGGRRRAARPPPRRRDDRAGRPDPARAGAADSPDGRMPPPERRVDVQLHRATRDGRRRADPDPAPTAGRRGRGIRRGAAGRRRAAPRDRQWRRVPVRRPDRPDRLGPRRGGPAPRRRRGARRRDEGPAVRRARARRRIDRPSRGG